MSLQDLYNTSNGVKTNPTKSSGTSGSRLKALYDSSNTGNETVPVAPPAPVITPPPAKPGLLSRIGTGIMNVIKAPSEALSNTKFMKEAAAGLNASPDISAAEAILKPAASLVGGASPENLPLVGETVKAAKEYIKEPTSEYAPDVTLGDYLIGLKVGAQGFAKQLGSGASTIAGTLVSPATGGRVSPEMKFNVPGIGEITNSQFNVAERVRQGEDWKMAILKESPDAILNSLFVIGLVSQPFLPKTVEIGKFNVKRGPGLAIPGQEIPKLESFKLYSPQKFTTPVSDDIVHGIAYQNGIDLRNTKYNPQTPSYFLMKNTPNGGIEIKLIQVKPSFMDTFISKLKSDPKVLPPDQAYTIYETTVDAKTAESVKPEPTKPAQTPAVQPKASVVVPPPTVPIIPPVVTLPAPVVPPAPVITDPRGRIPTIEEMRVAGEQLRKKPIVPGVTLPVPTDVNVGAKNLPKELSGAKPRYGYGLKLFTLDFKSDVDKALYIVAKEIPSKADEQYLKFLQDIFPSNSTAEIREKGKIIRSNIKELAKNAESGNLVIPQTTEIIKQEPSLLGEYTLEPSKAKTPEEIKTESQTVFGKESNKTGLKPFAETPTYLKQPVSKTEIKTLFDKNMEFRLNPVLTVDENKNLTFKGNKSSFSIKPEALGLNAEKLVPGTRFVVKAKSLKEKGAPQQMRGFKGGEAYASKGGSNLDAFENRIGEPAKTGKSDFKIYQKVEELIKKYAARVGEGYLPRGVAGVFYHNTENIRLKGMNDLSVASHEITHRLDLTNEISHQLMKITGESKVGNPIYDSKTAKLRKEITDIYVAHYPGGRRDHKLKTRITEGFATLLQKYVEQPTTTTQNYPNIVREFLKPGGQFYQPIIGEIINDLENIVTDYQRLDPLDKIGARVTSDINETGKESFLSGPEYIRTEIADEVYPIEKLATEAGVVMTKDDPSLWIRQYNSQSSLFANNVVGKRGYWAFKNGEFQKALDYNWGDLQKSLEKSQQFDQFNYYLVARDQYFNFLELDKLGKQIQEYAASESPAPTELIDSYKNLKAQLDTNGFSRDVVTDSYNQNKDIFTKEEKMFDALTREDLKFLNDPEINLLNDEDFKKFSEKEGYASLKRQFYDEIVGDQTPIKSGGIRGSKPSSLIRRKGSSRTIVAPVYNGIKNHAEILRKGLKQLVDNKIVKIALKNTHPDLFQPQELKAVPDQQTGAMLYPQEKDPNIIMGRIGNKRVPVLVDSYIKKTIDEILDFKSIGLFEKLLQGANRFFTKGTTGLFPGFTLTNFSIDQITAVAQTKHNYIPVYTPIKEFFKIITDKNSPDAKLYEEYMVMGGERQTMVGWQDLSARELAEKIAHERTGILKAIDYLNAGGDIISLPQKYSEIVTRASEYVKSRKAGNPQIVALEEAGRVTAPFHHIGRLGGGKFGKTIVKSIPFFNPALQVLEQTYRSGFKSGRKSSQRMLFVILAITAMQIAANALINSAGSKDQKESYKDLQPNEMSKYLWLPNPMDDKKLIKIRMPDLFNEFGLIINMATMDQVNNTNYTAGDYVSAGTSFLPQQFNVTNPPELMFAWIPQLLKPSIMVAANVKDFPTVQPLESQSQQAKEPGMRSTPSTPFITKKIGEFLNISPIKLDYLITGTFGRTSGFLTGKPGILNPLNSLSKDYYFDSGRRVQQFYDIKKKNDEQYNSLLHKLRPFTAEERINIMKQRGIISTINGLLSDYRDIDETKYPDKLEIYRNKILDYMEKL